MGKRKIDEVEQSGTSIFASNSQVKNKYSSYFLRTIVPTLIYGIFIGIVSGGLVYMFNYIAELLLEFNKELYMCFRNGEYLLLTGVFGLAIGLSVLSFVIAKFIPDVQGSGIPYTEGVMQGKLKFEPIGMGLGITAGAFTSFAGGLPLGGEGPSVTLGGISGLAVNKVGQKLFKTGKAYERLSVTGGASAGLAVAFNAPLTGIVFALEEGHKKISAPILISTISCVVFAVLTRNLINLAVVGQFFPEAYFASLSTSMDTSIDFRFIYMLLILGIVIGLAGAGFGLMQRGFKKLYAKIKLPLFVKILISFLLVAVIGIFVPDILGGGKGFIVSTALNNVDIQLLLLVFALRICLIGITSNSGVTGGLFVPMLCIGAMIGGIMTRLFNLMGLPEDYNTAIVVISMCAFMGAVSRAPLTAIVLTFETVGHIGVGLVMTILVVVISYLTIELCHITPFYEELLEGIYHRKTKNKKVITYEKTFTVESGSFICDREIRDVLWPSSCSVEKVFSFNAKTNSYDVCTTLAGSKVLHPNDKIVVMGQTFSEFELVEDIKAIVCNSKELDYDSFDDILRETLYLQR